MTVRCGENDIISAASAPSASSTESRRKSLVKKVITGNIILINDIRAQEALKGHSYEIWGPVI